jgi:hypothetical protein
MQFLTLVTGNKPKPTSNLSKCQDKLLAMLCKAKHSIITPTDKNLGPAIMEQSQYIEHCFQDHLLNESPYQCLSEHEATVLCYNSCGAIIRATSKGLKVQSCFTMHNLPILIEVSPQNQSANPHNFISSKRSSKPHGRLGWL